MTRTAEANELGSRAELRSWYVDHLRPMLVEAVADGILEQAALEHLDFEVADLFAHVGDLDCETA